MVVVDTEIRVIPVGIEIAGVCMDAIWSTECAPPDGKAGRVADVVEIASRTRVTVVPEPYVYATLPQTFQSPAVREIEVTFAVVPVVKATAPPNATSD